MSQRERERERERRLGQRYVCEGGASGTGLLRPEGRENQKRGEHEFG